MSERTLIIDPLAPLEFYGVNDKKIKSIIKHFPKLKIIARGSELMVIGDEDSLTGFEHYFDRLKAHFEKYGRLPLSDVVRLFSDVGENEVASDDSVLVYGPDGRLIKARTANQRKMVSAVEKDDMTFVIGPAGSGKTYTAVALAVRALKRREVKRIILTRPAVEAGEHIGFLPGDLKEKLDPYLQPLYDALIDMIPTNKLAQYLESGVIQIAPIGFMRGRTLDNAFVILDEAQNTTDLQMRMFLTRMGNSAKFVITGDVTQVDLPKHATSGLIKAWNLMKNVDGIATVELMTADIVRHPLVKKIVNIYSKADKNDE